MSGSKKKLAKENQNSQGNIPKPVSPVLSTGQAKIIENIELEKNIGEVVRKDLKKTPKLNQDQDKKQGNDKDQDAKAEEEQDQERKEEEVQDKENGMDQDQEKE